MKRLIAIVAAAIFIAPSAIAAELVLVRQDGCFYCETWDKDIGVFYHKTSEARIAPLRRVDIRDLPPELHFKSRPRYTPTFVVFDGSEEIGRLEGYPGDHFFWPLLDEILQRLPDSGA